MFVGNKNSDLCYDITEIQMKSLTFKPNLEWTFMKG